MSVVSLESFEEKLADSFDEKAMKRADGKKGIGETPVEEALLGFAVDQSGCGPAGESVLDRSGREPVVAEVPAVVIRVVIVFARVAADFDVRFVLVDQRAVPGDEVAALGGHDERPPIDFVEMNSGSVAKHEVVMIHEGSGGVPIFGGFPDGVVEIGEIVAAVKSEEIFIGVITAEKHGRAFGDLAEAMAKFPGGFEVLKLSLGRVNADAVDVEDVNVDAGPGFVDGALKGGGLWGGGGRRRGGMDLGEGWRDEDEKQEEKSGRGAEADSTGGGGRVLLLS